MRPRCSAGVARSAALLLAAVACTTAVEPQPPESIPATAARTATTARTAATSPTERHQFATSIVLEGLSDPILVPGEPRHDLRGEAYSNAPVSASSDFRYFIASVTLPPDWLRRPSLALCNWTAVDGFYGCWGVGSGLVGADGRKDLEVRIRTPEDVYELWLMAPRGGGPMRRLVAIEASTARWPVHLVFAPGYETVDAVLTRTPPSDGDYLVPVQP